MAESIVIVSAARTPIGGLLGDFASLAAWELGAGPVKSPSRPPMGVRAAETMTMASDTGGSLQ